MRPDLLSRGRPAVRRGDLLAALLLASAAAALCLGFELALDRRGAFDQWNLMFDADPNARIEAFAHGWDTSGRNFAHPNLANFVHLPIRATAMVVGPILTRVGGKPIDAMALRRDLALLVAPLAAGLQVALAFVFVRGIGASLPLAIAFTLLAATTFTQLVFGSIPDHFALSGAALGVAFVLSSRRVRATAGDDRWAWIALLVFTAGVTQTNAVMVALVLFVTLLVRGGGPARAFGGTLRLGLMALVLHGALYFGLSALFESRAQADEDARWARSFWMMESPWTRWVRAPTALAGAFAPGAVERKDNRLARENGARHEFRFTLVDTPSPDPVRHPLGFVVLVAALAGAVVGSRGRPRVRAPVLAALVVIGANLALHSLWGSEAFLYSQHWQFASLVAIAAGVVALEVRSRRVSLVCVGLLVIAQCVQNAALVRGMLAVLDGG